MHSISPITQLTVTTGAVCEMLGLSEAVFRKKRAELEAQHNFPGKLPGLGKYSLPAVRRWIETNGQTAEPAPADDALLEAAAALEAEYGKDHAA